MRHRKAHRKLGRTSAHRRQLLRNLVSSLFLSESGRIRTTIEKAKEARPIAEKMITLGKREGVHARRLAARRLPDRAVVKRLFDDIAPKFVDRNGGYTRILRVGPRLGDNADLALLELVGIAEAARQAAKAKGKADKKDQKDEKAKDAKSEAAAKEEKEKRAAAKAEAKARRDERKRARESQARPDGKAKSKMKSMAQKRGSS